MYPYLRMFHLLASAKKKPTLTVIQESVLKLRVWPGDIDIAPETLYSEATGESLPTWMEINFKSRSSNKKQAYLIDNTI